MTWETVKLAEAAEINPGLPKDLIPGVGDAVTFLSMASVGEDASVNTSETRAYGEVAKGYTAFCKGDVLLAKITPCMENGKAALVSGSATNVGCGSTEFHVLRARNGIYPGYLFHLIWNEPFRRLAARNMTGSAGQKRVPKSFLETHRIPIPHKNGKPDLNEQKRIAAILDKADAIRRKRQQALALADDFLRSVFLVMFGDPDSNPKGLPVGVVGDLLDSANYGTSKKASTEKGEYPVLRMGNITYDGGWDFTDLKYIDLDKKELPKHLVHKGQLLFNRTNSKELVGKTAVYREDKPMAFAGYLVRGIVKPDADAEYIAAYLNSPHGKQKLTQMCKSIVGMANINAKEMQAIPILLPAPEEQRRFGDIARNIAFKKRSWIITNDEAGKLFSSLQQRAFNGEL